MHRFSKYSDNFTFCTISVVHFILILGLTAMFDHESTLNKSKVKTCLEMFANVVKLQNTEISTLQKDSDSLL